MEEQRCSRLVKEVRNVPLVESAERLYKSRVEQGGVLASGLAFVHYSLSSVADVLYSHTPIAHRVDELAAEGLSKLKNNYSLLQESPEKLRKVAMTTVRTSVRKAMKTLPGRIFVGGLDTAIDVGEVVCRALITKLPEKRPEKRSARLQESGVPTIKGEGADVADDDKEPDAENEVDKGILMKSYNELLVKPAFTLLRSLKYIRRYVAKKPRQKRAASRDAGAIQARRTISPKKRSQSGIIGRLRWRVSSLLGYKNVLPFDLKSDQDGALGEDREKKRKHDEILSDASSGDEDFETFDYDQYDSEDDPDYEPPSGSDDSENECLSDDLDPESDIEIDHVDGSSICIKQIPVEEARGSEAGSSVDPSTKENGVSNAM